MNQGGNSVCVLRARPPINLSSCHTEYETSALVSRIAPGVTMTEQIQHSPQKHVVIGAGPAGRATARYLSLQNHSVILASRSGKGPTIRGVERIAVDATDAPALVRVDRKSVV